jgi:hypothetical protein
LLPATQPDDHATSFQVAGLRGLLTTNDPKFQREFRDVFFAEPAEADAPHVHYSVHVDRKLGLAKRHSIEREGAFFLVTAFYPALLPALERDIAATLFDTFTDDHYLRAGFVALDGTGILIVGDETSGCGWLVRALVDAGGVFFSDAITILGSRDLAAIPYVKSISLPTPGHALLSNSKTQRSFRDPARSVIRYHRPSRLPSNGTRQPIDCIVVPSPEKAATPRLDPLRKSDALERLMASTFNVTRWDVRILSNLADVVESAHCHLLVRGRSEETAGVIAIHVRSST